MRLRPSLHLQASRLIKSRKPTRADKSDFEAISLPDSAAISRIRPVSPNELAAARSQLDSIGFCQIRQALTAACLDGLQDEAIASFGDSHLAERGEGLSYEAYIADLGSASRAYLEDASLHRLLRDLLGRSFGLQAERSCLTYYLEQSFLSPHRDNIDGAQPISVITYLWAESPAPDDQASGLVLNLYADGDAPAVKPVGSFRTLEASVVIGHGTRFWHGRPRLCSQEKVIALTGSFFTAAGN